MRGVGAGTGYRVLRLRSPSAAHTLTGWRSRVPRLSRACDCSAAAAGAGGGVSRVETPGLGAAEAPGLLPCGCLQVWDRGSPSSLLVLFWLWDTQSGLFLPTWDTLFPEEERRPRVSLPRPAWEVSFSPPDRLSLDFNPKFATEPLIQIPAVKRSLGGPPRLLPPASDVLTSSNVTYSPIGHSATQNFNAKEKSGLVSQAF